MPFLEATDLTKTFGETVALDDVSFELEEGEFVSILGPSGSGKTTLLKILAGFHSPDSGTLEMDGEELVGQPPEDRDMSLVFQRLALFPHMSVRDNIAFGLKMKTDLGSAAINERISEMLELISLEGYEDRSITNLSGGEQQRVALARALVVEPKLMLYDEPLSDLDRQLREEMRREIKDLHERLGITSIYVTHNQREALTLSDRLMVLHQGHREMYDTPINIYNDPASEFIANFVGDSNFMRGEINQRDGQTVFTRNGFELPMEDRSATGSAMLYVRPEHIAMEPSLAGDDVYQAEVYDAVHLGSVTEYIVTFQGQQLRVNQLGTPRFAEGDSVDIRFDEYGVIE